jgi:hypothetical protein
MPSLEEYVAVFIAITVYTEQIVDFFSATTNNSAVSTALIVVLANASLGGNMTRIASVRAVAPAPNALGLANCEPLKMYGPVYKQLIEAQRRRKIEFFRPWPSEISLQVRTDSNFFEISNVTFSEWEEINEHYKRIREFYRLPTKEILPIRLLSFFYSLATQVLQQFNRVVAEVQLVVYEAFNYVSLLFLCPILALLCCLVKCKDDRTSLCWVLKLVSNRHPISGLCVHICDKIMESPTPTQPLSSGPDGVLETETENERIARLLAECEEMLSQSSQR